jgi:hypothetical protein
LGPIWIDDDAGIVGGRCTVMAGLPDVDGDGHDLDVGLEDRNDRRPDASLRI